MPPARAAPHLRAVRPGTGPAGSSNFGPAFEGTGKKEEEEEGKKEERNPRSDCSDPSRYPSGSPEFLKACHSDSSSGKLAATETRLRRQRLGKLHTERAKTEDRLEACRGHLSLDPGAYALPPPQLPQVR